MPGSDRCRTKGAFVYRYVPSLLPSRHPPILCFASTGDGPLPASVEASAVWLIWMWRRRGRKKEGGRAGGDWGLRWVRTQQAVLEGWALSLSLFLFFSFSSSSPAPGGVLPASTCSPEMPLLDNQHVPCRLLTPTQGEGGRHVGQGGW